MENHIFCAVIDVWLVSIYASTLRSRIDEGVLINGGGGGGGGGGKIKKIE